MCASYGATIALEDPRAGRALAARDRDEVLERDRDPEERVERGERRVRLAGVGEAGVGRVGLRERADRDPARARH